MAMFKLAIISTLLVTPLLAQAPAAPAKAATQQAHSAITPADRLQAGWWKKRHEQKRAAAQQAECDLLFIGDSITHGWEGAGKKVWAEYYSKRKPFNIGFSGDRTEHVLWRMDNGELAQLKPKVAVIMIGTNNTGHSMQKAEETAEGIKAIITKLQKHSPKTKVLLLAIFPRGEKPDHKMRVLNNRINNIIKSYADGKMVHYLDMAPAFLTDEGILTKEVMPDRLHPREYGYGIWAKTMEPKLKELLGE
ncbi:MAG: acetylglucosamine-6-sulfatase [Verrucomicrobiae bacterium]|nr:acetylglucosamine-6-sulfatase [Verrucomicrobiae bacterium]NNJ87601.1 acetylglucosamine-6-sulfatase [Akkermansiaceae bacterium]